MRKWQAIHKARKGYFSMAFKPHCWA